MSGFVQVLNGSYRNEDVSGETFELVYNIRPNKSGYHITVKNNDRFPGMPAAVRINIPTASDYIFVDGEGNEQEQVFIASHRSVSDPVPMETDEEIIARIRQRFNILNDMTTAATTGGIRALIVTGPPGVGKSHGIETIVERACLLDRLSGARLKAEVVKGSTSALGLYKKLYEFSGENCLLVLDDCDSALTDDVSLNLLKGALDSGRTRKISWLSDSRSLKEDGIPNQFTFNGAVIFITNLKFDGFRSQKLRDHLEAIQSRCHYVDLTLDSDRDKVLRIRQIAEDNELFSNYQFDAVEQDEIIEFIASNAGKLREISLRMAIKIADLRKNFSDKWQEMAAVTCMK